ncbi:TonB family protein [Thermodesulfobacteriota bacterium]
MKKQLSFVFILFVTIACSISYASEQLDSKEKVYKLKDVDTRPRVAKAVRPIYPIGLRGPMGLAEGRVVLKFIVTKEGNVRDPKVVESIPNGAFDESALEAVKKYRFKPATKNGEPVDCIAKMPFVFSLHNTDTAYDAYKASDEGLKYLKIGEYDKAIEAYTKAIKINKKYSPGYSGRAMAYMTIGEFNKAISDFNKAITRTPEHGLYYKLRGEAYSELKKYKKAIKDFSRAIEREPDMIEAYFARGEALRKSGKHKEAIEDYTKVTELDESYVQAYYNRAVLYNKLKDIDSMCLDLKKVCDLGDCKGFDSAKKAGKCSGDVADVKKTD